MPFPYTDEDSPARYNLAAFIDLVDREAKRNKGWRRGQTAFNVLRALRPDLAEQIMAQPDGTRAQMDPFYMDRNLPAFWEWVGEHWKTNKGEA